MIETILLSVGLTAVLLILVFLLMLVAGAISELKRIRTETTTLVALTNKYMHDQQQIANLFTQFIFTLNSFSEVVDEFTMLQSMNGEDRPFFPGMEEMTFGNSEIPPKMNIPELSEEESRKIDDLLSRANEEDEEDIDGETQ